MIPPQRWHRYQRTAVLIDSDSPLDARSTPHLSPVHPGPIQTQARSQRLARYSAAATAARSLAFGDDRSSALFFGIGLESRGWRSEDARRTKLG
jgi:hypothetical protein